MLPKDLPPVFPIVIVDDRFCDGSWSVTFRPIELHMLVVQATFNEPLLIVEEDANEKI